MPKDGSISTDWSLSIHKLYKYLIYLFICTCISVLDFPYPKVIINSIKYVNLAKICQIKNTKNKNVAPITWKKTVSRTSVDTMWLVASNVDAMCPKACISCSSIMTDYTMDLVSKINPLCFLQVFVATGKVTHVTIKDGSN